MTAFQKRLERLNAQARTRSDVPVAIVGYTDGYYWFNGKQYTEEALHAELKRTGTETLIVDDIPEA